MKRFEVIVSGANEEKVGLEILQGIYGALKNNGYADVSVNAETITRKNPDLKIPAFLTKDRSR